jgi:hypothetical protein
MYETMAYWETYETIDDDPLSIRDFVESMASGRQDRVFENAGRGLQHQNKVRTRIRS